MRTRFFDKCKRWFRIARSTTGERVTIDSTFVRVVAGFRARGAQSAGGDFRRGAVAAPARSRSAEAATRRFDPERSAAFGEFERTVARRAHQLEYARHQRARLAGASHGAL